MLRRTKTPGAPRRSLNCRTSSLTPTLPPNAVLSTKLLSPRKHGPNSSAPFRYSTTNAKTTPHASTATSHFDPCNLRLLFCRFEGDQPGGGIENDLEREQRAAAEDDRCAWRNSCQHVCRNFIENECADVHRLWRDSA